MSVSWYTIRRAAAAAVLALAVLYGFGAGLALSPTLDQPAEAQQDGRVPGQALGSASDSEFWRKVRQGGNFKVTIPDKQAGILIQSDHVPWRAWRNGPVTTWGGWSIPAVIVLLALFFVVRGRVRVEHGLSGRTIERFTAFERFAHWLTAGSFVVLALTGLNLMFGRYIMGAGGAGGGDFTAMQEVFASLTLYGKFVHNYVAFAFMAGLVIMFVIWLPQNIGNLTDIVWLAKGGGILTKRPTPPAGKFNGGQKLIFWLVFYGGLSLSLSGIALIFPFEFAFFSKTFAFLNVFGLGLPTDFTAIEEMQLSQLSHAVVALGMIVLIIAHIYIGTIGMEGAFWAMGTGYVDENWAREHHGAWVDQLAGTPAPAPAEGGVQGGDD